MADDMDVPPLEDMTDVLKQVDAIRLQRDGAGQEKSSASAKQRAKVNKKNVTGHSVAPETVADKEKTNLSENNATPQADSKDPATETKMCPKPVSKPAAPQPKSSSAGMFGGMKKGFLFGGPSKPTTKKVPTPTSTTAISSCSQQAQSVSPPNTTKPSSKTDEIPYITASGKTESGLTMDEVQQAMAETKGLLDNQDWITDDLLNKVEGNELLLKRFGDPTFMQALQEFQSNPQAAMEKYKTNKEVEKFLLEFCGLLGDHFTKLGSSQTDSGQTNSSSTPTPQSQPKPKPKQTAKIVELDESTTESFNRGDTSTANSFTKSKDTPKIVEIIDDKLEDSLPNLNLISDETKPEIPDIKTRQNGADIKEMPKVEDPDVKEVLKDSKVMETLLDPQVMNLVQTLRNDPHEAQRILDKADGNLKEKIHFLVSKGLLQVQNG